MDIVIPTLIQSGSEVVGDAFKPLEKIDVLTAINLW
jgi:hypothetical protein